MVGVLIALHSFFNSTMFSFTGAIEVSSGAFGDDTESAVLYNVDCYGNETEILNCSVNIHGTCPDHNAAVICQSKCKSCLFYICYAISHKKI